MNVNRLQIMFVLRRHCLPHTHRHTHTRVTVNISPQFQCCFPLTPLLLPPLPHLLISPPSIVVGDRWKLGLFVRCKISSCFCFPTVNLRFCMLGTLLFYSEHGWKTGYRLSISADRRTARTPRRAGVVAWRPCWVLVRPFSSSAPLLLFPRLCCPHVISVMQIPD